ncbi:hypothetical protein ACFLUT_02595 [Chloroflexota bacterium]
MRLPLALFLASSLALVAAGCSSPSGFADAAVDDDEAIVDSVGPASPIAEDAAAEESTAEIGEAVAGESACRGSTAVVSTVRNVYAVLALEVVGDSVIIDRDLVYSYGHVRFAVMSGGNDYEFFAYMIDDQFYVRAAICPCCGEAGLAHGGTCLSCHSCDTTLGLVTDGGDGGECAFPVGEIPYEIGERCVRMSLDNLVEAYERTAAGEAELFEPEPEPVENEADDTSWPRCCRR